jgi:signal transduction histidine kinase
MSLKGIVLACLLIVLTMRCGYSQSESELSDFLLHFSEKTTSPLEKTLQEANLRLEQANEINDAREKTGALRILGLIHLNGLHDYEKAMDLFIQSLAIEDSLELEDQKLLTYVAIARVFEVVGDYERSAHFLEQALGENENERSINSLALILNNLGKVNAARDRVEEAFNNYQQILTFRDDLDQKCVAEALFNLGRLYTIQGKYDEALSHHKSALAITRSLADRREEASSLNAIGILYSLMKNDAKSLANHEVALRLRQELNDQEGLAESYNSIGALYLKQGNFARTISNALAALQHGRESQAQEQIFKSSELLRQGYKGLGDYENALKYSELSLGIHEFIQNGKQERDLLETQNRYVVGKKESEIQRLQSLRFQRDREIAEQKRFRNFLFTLVALVFVIAGLLLILYLVKRRSNVILQVAKKEVQQQNEKLQELNHTKDKFFSIISHDLKGPLNSLTSFSHLLIDHTESLSKEEIKMLATDLDKSVKNLLTLLENLLEWSRSQTGTIDFSPKVFDLRELLQNNKNLLESQASTKKIAILLDAPEYFSVNLHKPSINTVVRNLVSNAIKFTREGGKITLGIESDKEKMTIYISDDGVGMSQEVVEKLFRLDSKHSTRGTADEKGTGLGLILCSEFIEKNGGKIQVKSTEGRGSVFTITFKASVVVGEVPATVAYF